MPKGDQVREAKIAHDADEAARVKYGATGDERRRAIRVALDAGATAAEIAKELGISPTRVTQLAKAGRRKSGK